MSRGIIKRRCSSRRAVGSHLAHTEEAPTASFEGPFQVLAIANRERAPQDADMAPFGRANSKLTYGCIAARKRICSTTGTNMGRRRGEEELASQVRDFGCLLRLELGRHDGSFFRDHQL
jgi:hypothetical protein